MYFIWFCLYDVARGLRAMVTAGKNTGGQFQKGW